MPVGEQCNQQAVHEALLADNHAPDLGADIINERPALHDALCKCVNL